MNFDLCQPERERAQLLPCGLKVSRGESLKGGPTAMIWKPKALKPYANYRFPSEARREAWIAEQVGSYLGSQRRLAERKAQRAGRTVTNAESVNVGDIFDYSWGYDQTNVEFFQVVAKSGRKVTVRELTQSQVAGSQGFMSATVLPVKDRFLEGNYAKTLTKLVRWTDDGRAYLSFEFGWCDKWAGTPAYSSWYA
jgi:hypothetical protein